MVWIIFTPLLLGLAAVLWIFGKRLRAAARARRAKWSTTYPNSGIPYEEKKAADSEHAWGLGLGVAGGAAALAWVIWTMLSIVWIVPAGYVGVVYRFGDIVGQRSEGLQLIAPWEDMKVASARVQRQAFDNLEAFSKETQDVIVDATLNYSVSPDAIQGLYRSVGPNWYEKLVPPRVRQTLKDEAVHYLAVDIAPNREVIRQRVRDRLREQLAQFSISVEDFLLDNIDFSPEFKKAIEDKQIATQQALAEANRVVASQNRAKQKIAEARGTARANQLVARSLTRNIIAFEAIQKLNPNVNTILVPAGSNLILPPELLKGGASK